MFGLQFQTPRRVLALCASLFKPPQPGLKVVLDDICRLPSTVTGLLSRSDYRRGGWEGRLMEQWLARLGKPCGAFLGHSHSGKRVPPVYYEAPAMLLQLPRTSVTRCASPGCSDSRLPTSRALQASRLFYRPEEGTSCRWHCHIHGVSSIWKQGPAFCKSLAFRLAHFQGKRSS